MQKRWRGLAFLFLFLLVLGALGQGKTQAGISATAAAGFMPLAEVRPGMRGIGKTVVSGTTIEEFTVEVLGILPAEDGGSPLLLVRVSGPAIDKSGGIAAGMSGSPVYIDGRLVGALGFGYEMTDHRVGIVMPIENMLKLFAYETEEAREVPVFTAMRPLPPGFAPLTTPLLVSGLRGRALAELEKRLAVHNFRILPGGNAVAVGADSGEESPTGIFPRELLVPGGTLAVQLARGGISVSALGTITYREGERLLAFGHPFLGRGKAGYLASAGYILETIPSLGMPFKMGVPLGPVAGTVVQDRTAGLLVTLGASPRTVTLVVRVKSEMGLPHQREFKVELVDSPELLTGLAVSTVLQALDTACDSVGPGTARVRFLIEGEGLGEGIGRENLYSSATDIAMTAVQEFAWLLNTLLTNQYQEVKPERISLDFTLTRAQQAAVIERVESTASRVRPGEEVKVRVTLRPYRQNPTEVTLILKIPADLPSGRYQAWVHPGYVLGELPPEVMNSLIPEMEKPGETGPPRRGPAPPAPSSTESLDRLLESLRQQKQTSDLTVDLWPQGAAPAETRGEKGSGTTVGIRPPEDASTGDEAALPEGTGEGAVMPQPAWTTSQATAYVLQGLKTFNLEIISTRASPRSEGQKGPSRPRRQPRGPSLWELWWRMWF